MLKIQDQHDLQFSSTDAAVLFSYMYSCQQVKVAFCCTPALLDHADQAEEEVPDSVTLIQSKRSQRTLQFQQDLLIHYSNNTFQVWEAENLNQVCGWWSSELRLFPPVCADCASPGLFGSSYNQSVHWQHRLWLLLRGQDQDGWSGPPQPGNLYFLDLNHRFRPLYIQCRHLKKMLITWYHWIWLCVFYCAHWSRCSRALCVPSDSRIRIHEV